MEISEAKLVPRNEKVLYLYKNCDTQMINDILSITVLYSHVRFKTNIPVNGDLQTWQVKN